MNIPLKLDMIKIKTLYSSKSLLRFEKKKIVSTNHIYLSELISDPYKDCLFDMETFDYFNVCKYSNIKNYSCLRFISDFTDKKWYIECCQSSEYLKKIILDLGITNININDINDTFIKIIRKKRTIRSK
jgi:hypothetical protein